MGSNGMGRVFGLKVCVRVSVWVLAFALAAGWCAAGTAAEQDGQLMMQAAKAAYGDPNGNTHVVCLADATQSYELYIPASVPTTGPAPICYGFDPGGNGKGTLLSLAAAAAANGWMLAVSNNSKNGPWTDIFTAQDAVLRDTEARFNLSATRRFAGGMSGGARASLALAFRYPAKVCGTLLLGAGWPVNTDLMPSTDRLIVYMIIGTTDSNFIQDIPSTQGQLVEYGIRTEVHTFNGGHVWPSADMVMAGCQWLNRNAENDPNSGLLPVGCRAYSLFCQPPTPTDGFWEGYWSNSGTGHALYDRFDNVSLPIAAVDWWGLSAVYNGEVGYWLPSDPAPARFKISIHPDNGGEPGPAVYQQTLTATREDLPHMYNRNYPLRHYRALFSAPVTLASGWVGIQQVRDSGAYEMVLNSSLGDWLGVYTDSAFAGYSPLYDSLAVSLGTEEMDVRVFSDERWGEPPFKVRFSGAVSQNVLNVVNWRWDFGDGDVLEGNEPNPVHIYEEEGAYTVTLTVSTSISTASATVRDMIIVSHQVPAVAPAMLLALAVALAMSGVIVWRGSRQPVRR